jgi:hypothetical protein
MNTIRIEQTVEIPAGLGPAIDAPRKIPVGRTILFFTPVPALAEQARRTGDTIRFVPNHVALLQFFASPLRLEPAGGVRTA